MAEPHQIFEPKLKNKIIQFPGLTWGPRDVAFDSCSLAIGPERPFLKSFHLPSEAMVPPTAMLTAAWFFHSSVLKMIEL